MKETTLQEIVEKSNIDGFIENSFEQKNEYDSRMQENAMALYCREVPFKLILNRFQKDDNHSQDGLCALLIGSRSASLDLSIEPYGFHIPEHPGSCAS